MGIYVNGDVNCSGRGVWVARGLYDIGMCFVIKRFKNERGHIGIALSLMHIIFTTRAPHTINQCMHI